MHYRKFCVVCFILLNLLLLVGCGNSPSPWSIVWSLSARAARNYTPAEAYEYCALARKPDGTTYSPAENTWLAMGSQPPIGLALSQLDPAGQFFSVGIITIDSGSNSWTLTDNGSLARPLAGSGVPAEQEAGKAWHLPAGTYHSLALEVPDTPPGGSVQLWVSDSNQEFVLARLYSTIQPPAGYTSVTLAGQSGWLVTRGRFTVIGLTLTTGIYAGLGTLIFAGTTDTQQSELLAGQAAANLNDILPS